MVLNKIKIGVFGPKPCFIQGHDRNDLRQKLRESIDSKIKSLLKQNFQVIGLSGMDIGVEEDFMDICLINKIPYHVYCTYEIDAKMWSKLPGQLEKMEKLINGADRKILISPGKYSPKKTLEKFRRIVEEADIILISGSANCLKRKYIISLCEKYKKTYSIINV